MFRRLDDEYHESRIRVRSDCNPTPFPKFSVHPKRFKHLCLLLSQKSYEKAKLLFFCCQFWYCSVAVCGSIKPQGKIFAALLQLTPEKSNTDI